MNKQVKNYFLMCEVQQVLNLLNEAREKYIVNYAMQISEAVSRDIATSGVKIDRADLKWIHTVRKMFLRQNPDNLKSVPSPHQLIALKYALLHPGPIHDYYVKKGPEGLEIYERKEYAKDTLVARVGNEMKKTAQDAGVKAGNDEEIANWWIEQNKDALHTAQSSRRSNIEKGGIPKPYARVVRRAGNTFDIEFMKHMARKYDWIKIRNVLLDKKEFLNKLSKEGFKRDRHLRPTIDKTDWDKVFKSDDEVEGDDTYGKNTVFGKLPPYLKDLRKLDDKAFKKLPTPVIGKGDYLRKPEIKGRRRAGDVDDFSLTGRPPREVAGKGEKIVRSDPVHPGSFMPGRNMDEDNTSPQFLKQYNDDNEFRTFINNKLIASLKANVGRFTNNKMSYGDSLGQTKDDLFSQAYMNFQKRTGNFDDSYEKDEIWKNWRDYFEPGKELELTFKSMIATAAMNAVNSILQTGNSAKKRSISFAAGAGGSSEEDDLPSNDPVDKSKLPDLDQKGSFEDKLISGLIQNPRFVTTSVVSQIKKMVKGNPALGDLLAKKGFSISSLEALANRNAMSDEDEGFGDEDEELGDSKYSPRAMAHRENVSPYSFKTYLEKRINETGVVWGNGRDSAKKLKPGETLKGGIQVSGAPWSAGGSPNKKGNDIQIK